MKTPDYLSVHELGQSVASSISGLNGGHEFEGVRISEPGEGACCYVSFGNVYGLGSQVTFGQVRNSFSMSQGMYMKNGDDSSVQLIRGNVRKIGKGNILEVVPELAKGFFTGFNSFCAERPDYVSNRFMGILERTVSDKLSGGKSNPPEFNRGHSYNPSENMGCVYFELLGYEADISFLNDGSGLVLVQELCNPSQEHRVIGNSQRQKLSLEKDELGRLTDEGLIDLADKCFDSFRETYKGLPK